MKVSWLLILFLGQIVCSRSKAKASASSDEDSDSSEVGYHSDDGDYAADATEDNDDTNSLTDAFKKSHLYELFGNPARQRNMARTCEPTEFEEDSNLACRDAEGRAVDWWFLYKEAGGERYLSYSSYDASQGRTEFAKLRNDFTIRNPKNSPLLLTLYQNYEVEDDSVWFAWNDDSNDGEDAYGQKIDGTKHAHAKGFFAIKSVPMRNDNAYVSSYAILHSLPRFPVIPKGQAFWNGVMKHTFPNDPTNIFDTNYNDKAQHFMCVSFQDAEMKVENNEIKYTNILADGEVNDNHPSYAFFLQKYLRTIHPAIIGTNFDDTNMKFAIWRQYFSLYSRTFGAAYAYLLNDSTAVQRQAYSEADLPYNGSDYHFNRLFPLSGSRHLLNGGYFANPVSVWAAAYSARNGCVTGGEDSCFGEAVITTTNYQFQSSFKLFAKHGASRIDIYDDWATLQLSEIQTNFAKTYPKQLPPKHGMLVQTWLDKGALPKKPSKKIYDNNGRVVSSVHIDNVGHLEMKVADGSVKELKTKDLDHSKWLLGFSLDSFNGDDRANENTPKFMPLFCVGDLNRTNTQAQLKGKNQGRGGGLMCTTNRALWTVMTTLKPQATRPKYANSNKQRAMALQKRLRPYTTSPFQNTYFDKISLNPYRKRLFQFLRISPDPLNNNKAVDFVSFLNELHQFLIRSRMAAERTVFFAFERFFESVAKGSILGAAKRIWDRVPDEKEIPEEFVPILRRLPSVVLARHEPQKGEKDDMVVMYSKKTDDITLMSEKSHEYIDTLLARFEEEKEVGVQTDFNEIPFLQAQFDEEEEEADEDYVPEEGSEEDEDEDFDSENEIKGWEYYEKLHKEFHSSSEDEHSDEDNYSQVESDEERQEENDDEDEEEDD